MVFNCDILLLAIIFTSTIVELHHATIHNHNTITSISSVLGTRLIFNVDVLNELTDDDKFQTIIWYKGIINLNPLISNSIPLAHSHDTHSTLTLPIRSHYHLVNRTKLLIEQTSIGDEGFYTLKIQINSTTHKHYHYHVVLFAQNLSLVLFPSSSSSSYQHSTYRAEQLINFTCSISIYADRTYTEQLRSFLLSTWHMIIYNNDPDHYQLLLLSSTSYLYSAHLFNYELSRHDHNQTVSCSLIQQELQHMIILNVTHTDTLNIEYKAYLRGNYYFTRSFNTYSSIEINCEEFDANPEAVYTLIWILNDKNQTLFNKSKHGRYLIDNATWQHRGNYICLAENYLNNNQPVHQSFRLNIWFNERQVKPHLQTKILALQQVLPSDRNQTTILILLIIIFVFACLLFILSFYYFCLRSK